MANPSPLWSAGLVEVTLPSGVTIRGVLPTLAELARHDLVPDNLRSAAMHFADPAWLVDSDETPPEETAKRHREIGDIVKLLVARFPLEWQDPASGEWIPDASPIEERLARLGDRSQPGQMDPLDFDLLEDLVLRLRTPEEVTAAAAAIRAGLSPKEALADETADATFREGSDGAAVGAAGQALGGPVACAVLPRRARRGTRARAQRGPDAP